MSITTKRFVKDNRFNAKAEGVGQYPVYKRVDLSPTYVEPPAPFEGIYEKCERERKEAHAKAESNRIWDLVRQSAGDPSWTPAPALREFIPIEEILDNVTPVPDPALYEFIEYRNGYVLRS